jgi:hypothetical protein
MGIFLASEKVKWRMRMGVPRVSASISSVAVAYTFPAFANAAQVASASQGAYKKG